MRKVNDAGRSRVFARRGHHGIPVTKLIAALACAACAVLSGTAFAAVSSGNATATRAYLRAGEAYEGGSYAEFGATVAAIDARAGEIGGECPSALTYAPRDTAFGELGEELGSAVFYASLVSMRGTLLRQSQAIAYLRWSDRRLTRLVHAEAAEERAILALTLPDVCADIAAWKASAYAALPPSATGFLARVRTIESASFVGPLEESREGVIRHLLRPYEGPAERRTAKRIAQLEEQLARRLGAAATAARAKLATALGVATL
jgi:hypothetical protein